MQGIEGKILKIKPVSIYDGKTYTQDVIVEFAEGIKASVSDERMLCNEKGTNRKIILFLTLDYVGKIEKSLRENKKILPLDPFQKNYLGPYADVCGTLVKIFPEAEESSNSIIRRGILDVGIGEVELELPPENYSDLSLKPEDKICISHAQLILQDIIFKD